MKKLASRGALALGIVLALAEPLVQAAATTKCSDSTVTDSTLSNPGYLKCYGPYVMELASDAALTSGSSELVTLKTVTNGQEWQRVGKSGQPSDPFVSFSATSGGKNAGELTFQSSLNTNLFDLFFIGLQAIGEAGSPAISFYELSYAGTFFNRTISFDTLGIDTNSRFAPGLQAAAFYVPVVPNGGGGTVPEPGTWMLAFIALAALGVTSRQSTELKPQVVDLLGKVSPDNGPGGRPKTTSSSSN